MPKNPHLAHYFGTALDCSSEEDGVGVNATRNFSYFPTAKHMTQHVFCPSRGTVPVNDSCAAACMPLSGVSADFSHTSKTSRDKLLLSMPSPVSPSHEATNRLPSLLLQELRLSTPSDVYSRQNALSHSGVSLADGDSPVSSRKEESSQQPAMAIVDRGSPCCDSMTTRSRAAISRVREALEHNKEIPAATNSCPTDVFGVLSPDEGWKEEKTAQIRSKDEGNISLTPLSSCISPSTAERQQCDAINLQPPFSFTFVEATAQKSVEVPSLENKEGNTAQSQTLTSGRLSDTVRPDDVDFACDLRKPTALEPLKAKCLVLTLNSDALGCVAKRLSRRPPNTVVEQTFQSDARCEAGAVRSSILSGVTAEKPIFGSRDGKPRSRHRKRDSKEGVISVNSLYGILERLADVVHPRPVTEGTQVNLEEKRVLPDAVDGAQRDHNIFSEGCRVLDVNGRKNSLRKTLVSSKVLMGSAPSSELKEGAVDSPREAISSTFPTSQLPSVGVGGRHTPLVQQQTPSAKRRSVSRPQKTPGYALPTESWLYKGAELDEAHVDTSCTMEEAKTKGPSR